MNKSIYITSVMLTALLTVSCSIKKMAIRQIVSTIQESRKVFEMESDLEIAEIALASNLKLLEAMQVHDPENRELDLFLAEGFSTFALAFIEDKAEQFEHSDEEKYQYQVQRAIKIYNRARRYAGIILADLINVESPEAIEKLTDDELKKRIDKLDKDDVGPVFWYAMAWGSSVNLDRENMDALSQLAKIEILIAKVKVWDPKFYFGGPYLFDGMYYGSRTKMLNGDPEKAKKGFEEAMKVTDKKFLIIPYFYAKTYCVQYQDKQCFEENLDYVINTPADIFPVQLLANTLAKRKAVRLKALEKELFLNE